MIFIYNLFFKPHYFNLPTNRYHFAFKSRMSYHGSGYAFNSPWFSLYRLRRRSIWRF